MAWSYLWGLDLPEGSGQLLLMFLTQNRPAQSQEQTLNERLAERVQLMLSDKVRDWPGLCLMLARAGELGLKGDWWAVQNRLWDLRHTLGPGRDFAARLGLSL